ncbi:MAG: energy-coupling factor transporter ATPase [Limosilactobacillus sp.]|uniref:energy-coupling factor transporter ATPase n=1 Tax=Limosilactobacillus sp. TaxID=2773925 RepID=UPI00270D5C53|nr:energy-coupling factor transporter ATPase [Limosilactobacillus sp.]
MDGIKLQKVSYTYPGADKPVIDKLDLEIPANKWTTIIGHNGSGKSTIARLIDGLMVPEEGTITVNGLEVNEENLTAIHGQIGIVFQNPDNQFVGATVGDDIAFGLENNMVPREDMQARIDDALAQVEMTDLASAEPTMLSGGQKQRVAIAGILALHPKIIILDEATSMLDPQGRKLVLDLLADLRQRRDLTIISITHDPIEMAMADNVVVINEHGLAKQGPVETVLNDVTLLNQVGVGIPVGVALREKLSASGVDLPSAYVTENEMVEWICQKLN